MMVDDRIGREVTLRLKPNRYRWCARADRMAASGIFRPAASHLNAESS